MQKGKENADGWLLSLKTIINNALGTEIWSAIRVSLVPYKEKKVAVITCPKRAIPTWLLEDKIDHFWIRAGNAKQELTGRLIVTYTHEHWPA